MSEDNICFICHADVGTNGGIVSTKCLGGCERNYCHDCIGKRRDITRSCPICKNFLYLTVWTGTGMFVALTCVILSCTAIAGYVLEKIKLDKNLMAERETLVIIILWIWVFQILYLLSFLFIENYGIFEKWLSPIVKWYDNGKWYDNVKSRIYTIETSISHSLGSAIKKIYHSLSPVIKTVTPYVNLGLLCIWVTFIGGGLSAFVTNTIKCYFEHINVAKFDDERAWCRKL